MFKHRRPHGKKIAVATSKNEDNWLYTTWRPTMAWVYMATCITDFILFPIFWALLHAALKQPLQAWNPITLQGAGLFHVSMGAIIGISAFGRTQEKLAGVIGNTNSSEPAAPVPPAI